MGWIPGLVELVDGGSSIVLTLARIPVGVRQGIVASRVLRRVTLAVPKYCRCLELLNYSVVKSKSNNTMFPPKFL